MTENSQIKSVAEEEKRNNAPRPPSPQPLTQSLTQPLEGVKHIIMVGSGKGGVGKSTVAVNLAVTLHKSGYKTGLVDADIHGPSVARMMDITKEPEVVDNQMIPPIHHGVKCMSMGFLIKEDSPVIWRGPMITKALYQLLRAAKWGELDYLIIDMPPGTGDIHLSIAQNFFVEGAVIVTTAQQIAIMDVKKCVNMLKKLSIPILGIVENMSYFKDPGGNKHYIFGESNTAAELAYVTSSKLIGEIPVDASISLTSDQGEPIVLSNEAVAAEFKKVANTITDKLEKQKEG